ncbi:reverse transcriptase, partial [Globisporangium splendens]
MDSDGGQTWQSAEIRLEDCPHLSIHEWNALGRIASVVGERVVLAMLQTLSPDEHHNAVVGYMAKEIEQQLAAAPRGARVESLKVDVARHKGGDGEPLLRWLVELDAAVLARQIHDPALQVSLHDPSAFLTYEDFKSELKLTFEPPKNEFRCLSEFLDLRQGKLDIQAYSQKARYLVSNIVLAPVAMATQVAVYMKGLNDGPIKTYLFRDHPETLEDAISRSIQEDFSLKQTRLHTNPQRGFRPFVARPQRGGGPEPMDLSAAAASPAKQSSRKKSLRCNRGLDRPLTIAANRVCTLLMQKRSEPVGAGRPTGSAIVHADIGHVRLAAPGETASCHNLQSDKQLITLRFRPHGTSNAMRALFDTGASNNFVRAQSLLRMRFVEVETPRSELSVRLATGATVTVLKRVIRIRFSAEGMSCEDDFIVLDLDDKFDVILGIPWMSKHKPTIDWHNLSIGWKKQHVVDIATVCNCPVSSPSVSVDTLAQSRSSVESDGPISSVRDFAAIIARNCQVRQNDIASARLLSDNGARMSDKDRHAEQKEYSHTGDKDRRLVQEVSDQTTNTSGREEEVSTRSSDMAEIVRARGAPTAPLRKKSTSGRIASTTCHHQKRFDGEEDNVERIGVLAKTETGLATQSLAVCNPPKLGSQIVALPALSWRKFVRDLRSGEVEQVCIIVDEGETVDIREQISTLSVESSTLDSSSAEGESVLSEKTKVERFTAQCWESLKATSPYYEELWEFADVFPEEVPCELPKDKGTQHEIDLAIDEFFEARHKAGHVRESISPHSSPTFRVKKATGGWRIVHAFNKLNAATIPAQTPIPRKDVIIDGMSGSTVFSALDLRDGFYQILMREKDISLTAVSTPSGMLWEWLVMPQGLKNAPATFNSCVTHLLRSVRDFAPSYSDDVFIHSKAEDGKSEVEVHKMHLCKVLELMRLHKLYANLKKCTFGASEIPVLGCFVSKNGVRPDPEKIKAIVEWSPPNNVKDLRKFLGLATYLHKYSRNYAVISRPLSQLLKKGVDWRWTPQRQESFETVKRSLTEAPVLAIADHSRAFHVVCDASDFAIGCALMQRDHEERDRVVYYQSRQLRPAERNYPVHDKELLV